MSFLNELIKKKEKLKSCETVVTSLAGYKILEKKNEAGEIEQEELSEKCSGFVVDEKLDLQVAQVLEFLYLSSQDVAQDLNLLKKYEITHVLSVGVDLPNSDNSCKIMFKKVELLDEPAADILSVLTSCFEFIEKATEENKNNKVLVHCNAGYSRAPSVVIAYLIKKYNYSLNESFLIVKQKRNIKPNSGFMEQLKQFEKLNMKTQFDSI